jgi:hypothetical protein
MPGSVANGTPCTLHLITETYFLGRYLLTHLKENCSYHILIEIFYKFPTPMHGRKVEKKLKSCGKINVIINREGSRIIFTEKKYE